MKTYEITKTAGAPDWNTIPAVRLDCHLWSNVRSIVPSAQAAWDEDALYIRLQAAEPNVLCRYHGDMDPVYEDSCLEFFFSPDPHSDCYFNFECNPNGSFWIGYGLPCDDRCRLHRPDWKTLLQIAPFTFPGGWGIEYRIPVRFIRMFAPEFRLYAGMHLQANFYKCGDATPEPHFIAWNPVEAPNPDFHLPEFFGTLILK